MISRRVDALVEADAAYPLRSADDDREVVRLSANENPLGPPDAAVNAIAEAAADCWRYPSQAPRHLRTAIADAVGLDREYVRLGNGSDELLDLICRAFFDPGDRIVIPTPTFSVYELAARLHDLDITFVDAEPPTFAWEVSRLRTPLENAAGIFLCRPNNPTGFTLERNHLLELLDTDALVVVDEAYVDFTDDSVASWVRDNDNLLVTRSFSKLYGLAGVRIGYALANPDFVDTLGIVRPPYSVNRPAQAAALAALGDKAYVREVRRTIAAERERVAERLRELDVAVRPSDVNFLLVSPEVRGLSGSDLAELLAKRGVEIRDLAGVRGISEEWARITIGRPADNDRLLEAVTEIVGGTP